MSNDSKKIGLAVIGCGTIGRIRSSIARDYPGVEWIGLCDLNKDLGNKLAKDIKADYFTTDMSELLRRPEVNAAMILTDENCHTEPTLLAIEHNHKIFVLFKPKSFRLFLILKKFFDNKPNLIRGLGLYERNVFLKILKKYI